MQLLQRILFVCCRVLFQRRKLFVYNEQIKNDVQDKITSYQNRKQCMESAAVSDLNIETNGLRGILRSFKSNDS